MCSLLSFEQFSGAVLGVRVNILSTQIDLSANLCTFVHTLSIAPFLSLLSRRKLFPKTKVAAATNRRLVNKCIQQ
jgi:hypothetical protein